MSHPISVLLPQPCSPSSAALLCLIAPPLSRPHGLCPSAMCLPPLPSQLCCCCHCLFPFQSRPVVLLFPGFCCHAGSLPNQLCSSHPMPSHFCYCHSIVPFSPSQWCCCPKGSAAMLALSVSVCPCHTAYVVFPPSPVCCSGQCVSWQPGALDVLHQGRCAPLAAPVRCCSQCPWLMPGWC